MWKPVVGNHTRRTYPTSKVQYLSNNVDIQYRVHSKLTLLRGDISENACHLTSSKMNILSFRWLRCPIGLVTLIFHPTCGTSCVSLGAFYQTKLGFSHQLTNVTTAKVTETGGQGSRTTVGPHLSQGVLQGCIGLVWNPGWDSKQVFKLFKRVSVIFFSSILCICHLGDGAIDMCFPFFFQLSPCWSPFFCLSLLGRVREF